MLKSGIVNTKCNMVREIMTDQAGFQLPNPGQLKFYSGVLVVLIEIWLGFIFQLMPLNQDKSLPRLVH